MRWGNDLETELLLPKGDMLSERNNGYWKRLLERTIPKTVGTYGTDPDYFCDVLENGLAVPRAVDNSSSETRSYDGEIRRVTETYNPRRARKLQLIAASALTAALLVPNLACGFKDTVPPVIQNQSYGFYQNSEKVGWIVEGESVDFRATVSDEREVKEGYVQLKSGLIIPLSSVPGSKEGENQLWEGNTNKIQIGDNVYELVVRDAAGNESKASGEITVYPYDADNDEIGYRDELKYGLDPNKPNPVSKYALDHNLGIYVPKLSHLDEGGMSTDEKALIDLLGLYYPKVSQLVPSLYDEILILPELSTVEGKDVEAIEDILGLASNLEYKKPFESMLSEGIPENMKYCSTLEAALWKAYDIELENYGPLKNYSTENLIKDAWSNSKESMNYKSDRWKDFFAVTTRLNSPKLILIYMSENFLYYYPGSELWSPVPAYKTFSIRDENGRMKGDCSNQSIFADYCFIKNGYKSYILSIVYRPDQSGHSVVLYEDNSSYYYLDNTGFVKGIFGPFKSVKEAENNQINILKSHGEDIKNYRILFTDYNWTPINLIDE